MDHDNTIESNVIIFSVPTAKRTHIQLQEHIMLNIQ